MGNNTYCGDRIWQAYNGELGLLQQKKARERIHWLCEHVNPGRILDVGCSQGIADVLLAREGMQVIGLDIDPDAISYAEEYLGKEDPEVQKNLAFYRKNFLTFEAEPASFDTIVLTEVLEHMVRPAALLQKAVQLLKQDGIIIVTVPFGINDFHDHKRTYYAASLLEHLQPFTSVQELSFHSGWLGAIVRQKEHGESLAVDYSLMRREEDGFFELERGLRDANERLREQKEAALKERSDAAAQCRSAQEKLMEAQTRSNALQVDFDKATAENKVLQESFEKAEAESKTLQEKLEKAEAESKTLQERLEKAEAESKALQERLEKAEAESKTLQERLEKAEAENKALQENLEKATLENKALQNSVDEAHMQDEMLQSSFNEAKMQNVVLQDGFERSAAENRSLQEELEKVKVENQGLENSLERVAAQNRALQNSLEETKERCQVLNSKLRNYKEQYSRLAGSKLGKIQVDYWKKNNTKKKKDQKAKSNQTIIVNIKEGVKKYPHFTAFLYRLKGEEEKARQILREHEALERAQSAIGTALPAAEVVQTLPAAEVVQTLPAAEAVQTLPVASKLPQTEKKPQAASAAQTTQDYDMEYFERIRPMVEQMPQSNGSRYYKKHPGKIGWLAEQFRYDAFKSSIDGVILTPDNWREAIEGIDLLLVTSGWRGVNNAWPGFGKPQSDIRKIIYEVIEECKRRGIPTAFYSVEDPPNYQIFIEIARRCDYVFTATVEMLPQYRVDCGHDRIYNLSVAIDPLMHNPIGMRKFDRFEELFFAGSWMPKYPERLVDTVELFEGALRAGRKLKIVDRNLLRPEVKYRFPEAYVRFVSPPLDHSVLQSVHKLYDWGFNLNSVKNSKTMFANRAYEMLALGNLVISNESIGIDLQLPTIYTCGKREKVEAVLKALSPEEIYERQMAGLRYVLRGNTCFERMGTLLNTVGLGTRKFASRLAVVLDKDDERCMEAFQRQTYQDKHALSKEEWLEKAEDYDMVAFFTPDAFYGDFYLEDMVNGFKYTDCDYITKAGYMAQGQYIVGTEHDFVDEMPDKNRTVFWRSSFDARQLLDMTGAVSIANGYSIDRFEYDAQPVERKEQERDYRMTVVLPVYNDGWYLYGKAFSSLRRNPLFDQMEIVIMDAGSDDRGDTQSIIRSLARRYSNIRTYNLEKAETGNLLHAIVKGFEMASAPYVTVLFAQEEAANDGYTLQLQEATQMPDKPLTGDIDAISEARAEGVLLTRALALRLAQNWSAGSGVETYQQLLCGALQTGTNA